MALRLSEHLSSCQMRRKRMSEQNDSSSVIAAFGHCEKCQLPRTAEVEEGELILLCANGHRSD